MKEIPFTQFKTMMRTMKAREFKELKSFKVTSDGTLLSYCVIPQGEKLIRSALIHQVEDAVEVNNIFGGKEIECISSDGVSPLSAR